MKCSDRRPILSSALQPAIHTALAPVVGGCGGGSASPPTAPLFSALLTHSLIPEQAGDSTPTFTRASEAYVKDFEGLLKRCKSGEARFQGARRVENMCIKSEGYVQGDIGSTTSPIYTTGSRATATAQPDGSVLFEPVVPDFDGLSFVQFNTPTVAAVTGEFVGGIKLWTDAGTVQIRIRTRGDNDYVASGDTTVTVTTVPTTFYTQVLDTGSVIPTRLSLNILGKGGGGGSFYAEEAQVESVSGQANQSMSEYVSSGVGAFPYHGAGVDGVQYFTTDRSGSAIPQSDLFGYMSESASTNIFRQSEEFTQAAWFKARTTVIEDATVTPDGATSKGALVAGVEAVTTHYIYQSTQYTTGNDYTLSVFIKPADKTWCYMSMEGGNPSTNSAYFNLTGLGAVGTTEGVTAGISAEANGWYRCWITRTSTTTGNLTSRISMCSVDNNPSFTGDGSTVDGYLFGAQVEESTFASSYIKTEADAASRQADVLAYPDTDNFSDTAGTLMMQTKVNWNAAAGTPALFGKGGGIPLYGANGQAANRITGTDGTNYPNPNSVVSMSDATRDVSLRWGAQLVATLSEDSSSMDYDGSFNAGVIGIGCRGTPNLDRQWNGTIKNVKIYDVEDAP